MYEKITDALRRGAVAEALSEAQALVAANPGNAQAYRWLAAAQQMGGQAEAALESIGHAIALAPEDSSFHLAQAGILLGLHQVDAAQSALARTSALDPNELSAYLIRAQLALGRGDLEEAERLNRLASRVAPEHPQLAAVDGMLALRRGQGEQALKLVVEALQRQPDNTQLLYALGFIHEQLGTWAFAEQAFRRVMERVPESQKLRMLIANLLARQGRPREAVEELAPLLADPATATPAVQRQAGLLHMALGQGQEALPLLRAVFAAWPGDGITLQALVQAWRGLDAGEEARNTLDSALATTTDSPDLWRARLEWERPDSDIALTLVERWVEAMPGDVPALEVLMRVQDTRGQAQAAEATARRIVELEPGRTSAEHRVIHALLERNPEEAVAYVSAMIEKAHTDDAKQLLLGWKAGVHDAAGQHADAVASWMAVKSSLVGKRLPLWSPTASEQSWPLLGPVPEGASHGPVFVFGPPGSRVESVAIVLDWMSESFRADRFSPEPPKDGFQNYNTIDGLASGGLSASTLIDEWRATLPRRRLNGEHVIDWLLWWDNALLHALRPRLPDGLVLFFMRDPRDMFLDWLAFDPVPPLAFQSAQLAAQWLARVLEQIAVLHEQDLFPHRLIKLDDIHEDPVAIVSALSEALQASLPVPAPGRGPRRLPPGHWRQYAHVLAEPFALLTPVAVRLGYPEN